MTRSGSEIDDDTREAASAVQLVEPIFNRIENCEAKAYHLLLQIQPHAVFLAIDPATFRIACFSENLPQVLGRTETDPTGVDVRDLLSAQSSSLLRSFADLPARSRLSRTLTFGDPDLSVDALVYRSNDLICIEFEASVGAAVGPHAAAPRFLELIERITQAEVPSAELSTVVCNALRILTGFNRVYYCLFDEDGHGHVIGESRDEALPSLLDHHFPATDIPQAARRIFALNPFRLVPDAQARPVPIVGRTVGPLDLTMSACRAVAETHLQYIRNMGVAASFSYSVVRDGRLAAIFGGHHAQPLAPSWREIAMGRHLVELFKGRYDSLRVQEDAAIVSSRLTQLYAMAEHCKLLRYDLYAFAQNHHQELCDLIDADDVICRFEGKVYAGRSLEPDAAVELLGFLEQQDTEDAIRIDCLARLDHRFGKLIPAAAGALAIRFGTDSRNTIAWLRNEAVFVEKWSGDPRQAAIIDEQGAASPRTSFLAFQREVKGHCRPWSTPLVDLAHHTRQVFLQITASLYESRMRAVAEQSSSLKSEFLANISHELRSPMHSIIGFADLLASGDDKLTVERRKTFAAMIQSSGKRLLHLIDDLLDLSKLEAQKLEIRLVDADVREVIDMALAEMSGLAATKSLQIGVDDRRRRRLARFDTDRITQVIVNLLANAIKFSPRAGRILISLENDEGPDGSCWRLEVADEGIGIPDSERESIFDKFTQSSRTKNGAGGTGLGLAIGREIVAAHRGRIWAAEQSQVGARLVVEIPTDPESIRNAP